MNIADKKLKVGNLLIIGFFIAILFTIVTISSCESEPEISQDQSAFSAGPDLNKHASDANFTQVATGMETSVSYFSSNSAVATVHPTTGEVDIVTEGDTTITVSATENENFNAAIDSYVLTVYPSEFITYWQTTTTNESILIPINSTAGNYSYTVDWGDETTTTNVNGNGSHSYAIAGIYTVKISGDFPAIRFLSADSNDLNDDKIQSIENWGDILWTTMNAAFAGCDNVTSNASDNPNFSLVTNMSSMFSTAYSFNGDLSSWDVSSVTDMNAMFANTSFNGYISSWDVSSVTDMYGMFYWVTTFNQDISSWDVSSVTDISFMFYEANTFNQDISSWNVSSVVDIQYMFYGASTFYQNISSWSDYLAESLVWDSFATLSGIAAANNVYYLPYTSWKTW